MDFGILSLPPNSRLEEVLKRLVKTDQAQEEDLEALATIINQDKFADTKCALNPMHVELLIASKHPQNPFHFSQFPFDVNQATFTKIIMFSKEHLPTTYRWVLELKSETMVKFIFLFFLWQNFYPDIILYVYTLGC